MRDLIEAQKRIAERRATAQRAYDDVLATLEGEEGFEESYRRLSSVNFEIARRKVFREDASDLVEEKNRLTDLVEKAFAEKGAVGFGKPNYSCAECEDTGYVDGKRCACLEKERISVNLEKNPVLTTVPDRLKEIDFSFYKDRKGEYVKTVTYVNNYFVKGDRAFCTLTGKAGTGKSFVATIAVKEFLLGGKMVSVLNAVKLNKIFLEYHCAYLADKGGIWETLIEPDVLLIDDLGAESVLKNVTEQYLYELLVERFEKKTILTTNLSLEKIGERYNQRIMSRLSDKRNACVLQLDGEDLRIG